jgi:hypothetical protein
MADYTIIDVGTIGLDSLVAASTTLDRPWEPSLLPEITYTISLDSGDKHD